MDISKARSDQTAVNNFSTTLPATRTLAATPIDARPTQPTERLMTLDVLRGFALFGILLVNMPLFINPVQYAMLPHPDASAIDRAATWFIRFAAEGKFFPLFSFLFGLGFTLQMMSADAKGQRFVPRYLRRAAILLVFGLIHGFLIWVGDILLYYAILGLLLIFFRRMKLKWVWTWVVVLFLLPSLFMGLGWFGLAMAGQDPEVAASIAQQFADQQVATEAMLANSYDTYANGNFAEITMQRGQDLLFMWGISLFIAPTILAMFLIGLVFGRQLYFHHADQHRALFRNLLIWGGIVGVIGNAIYATLIASGVRNQPDAPVFIATLAQGIGGPALTLAYIAAITLAMLNPTWQRRLSVLAPVGRMALTNYLLQSIICTTIFYGYGFGLFGQVGSAAGIGLTVVIYLLQIPWSHWWLARFRFGPVEWLWRTLTYLKSQPMRVGAK